LRPFELVSAGDSRQAIALLAEYATAAKVLAGGTDLLVDLKSGTPAPRMIVDISRAEDMRGVALTKDGLRIGAITTHSEILRSPLVREHAPALAAAVRTIGAVQTRNLGTIGGNLATAVPSLDGGPPLVALDAQATLAGPRGQRKLPLAEFFAGPRKTALEADELLLEIVIPRRNLGKPAAFLKFGLRKGQALALVNVAASFRVDPARNAFVDVRIALGAVAPTVIRASQAEAYLEGRAISPEAMARAGEIAVGDARPIDDFRASAAYRRELIAVLTRRALASACADSWAGRERSAA
jgi:CO/xanthine dehydrogenase FAD-binding subunit